MNPPVCKQLSARNRKKINRRNRIQNLRDRYTQLPGVGDDPLVVLSVHASTEPPMANIRHSAVLIPGTRVRPLGNAQNSAILLATGRESVRGQPDQVRYEFKHDGVNSDSMYYLDDTEFDIVHSDRQLEALPLKHRLVWASLNQGCESTHEQSFHCRGKRSDLMDHDVIVANSGCVIARAYLTGNFTYNALTKVRAHEIQILNSHHYGGQCHWTYELRAGVSEITHAPSRVC